MSKARKVFLERVNKASYILPAIFTSFLWAKGKHHFIGISCPFREVTGIPCPSCFLTRATCNALQGNFSDSINQHLFGPIAALGLIFWSFYAIKNKRIFSASFDQERFRLLLLLFSFIAYWLIRITISYGFNINMFPET